MTGKVSYIYNEDGSPPNVKFHCDECSKVTEGFSLCLKCNPQTYKIINVDKALAPSEFEKAIWNEAIEAAAKLIEDKFDFLGEELLAAIEIRKLKK